jgi:hypothetical protein
MKMDQIRSKTGKANFQLSSKSVSPFTTWRCLPGPWPAKQHTLRLRAGRSGLPAVLLFGLGMTDFASEFTTSLFWMVHGWYPAVSLLHLETLNRR